MTKNNIRTFVFSRKFSFFFIKIQFYPCCQNELIQIIISKASLYSFLYISDTSTYTHLWNTTDITLLTSKLSELKKAMFAITDVGPQKIEITFSSTTDGVEVTYVFLGDYRSYWEVLGFEDMYGHSIRTIDTTLWNLLLEGNMTTHEKKKNKIKKNILKDKCF
jgi:hypothetical protein